MKRHIQTILKKCQSDWILVQSSSMAFTCVLSLVPLIALAYAFFSAFGGMDRLQVQIQEFVISNLAPSSSLGDQVIGYLDSVRTKVSAGAVGVFGVFGFIYTGYSMLAKIENTLNMIWGIRSPRTWARRVTNYWTLMTLGPLVFGFSLYSSAQAHEWLKNDNGEIARLLVFLFAFMPYFVTSSLFSFVYIVLPNTKIPVRSAVLAGAISGLAFETAKTAYGVYAQVAIGKSFYGSLAALPIFLVWLQLACTIFLFGAELCFYFANNKRELWPDKVSRPFAE